MKNLIEAENLSFSIASRKILDGLNFSVPQGSFVALLGENGAGKTTLIDLMLGFRRVSSGSIRVLGADSSTDPWQTRAEIAYLSERVDVPGDWTVKEFLEFNSFFYRSSYSQSRERELSQTFKLDSNRRFASMSAGEIRRVQVVGALAAQPKLVLVDEITAVLDIVGRRKFMQELRTLNQSHSVTIVLATNILEELADYATHILLIQQGKCRRFASTTEYLQGRNKNQLLEIIASDLETI